jgi:FHS family L-fucose permease-like MFS transporter
MPVPLYGFCITFAYLLYLNLCSRKELDGFRNMKIGYVDGDGLVGDRDRELRRVSLRSEEKGVVRRGIQGF